MFEYYDVVDWVVLLCFLTFYALLSLITIETCLTYVCETSDLCGNLISEVEAIPVLGVPG